LQILHFKVHTCSNRKQSSTMSGFKNGSPKNSFKHNLTLGNRFTHYYKVGLDSTIMWDSTVMQPYIYIRLYRVFGDEWSSTTVPVLTYLPTHHMKNVRDRKSRVSDIVIIIIALTCILYTHADTSLLYTSSCAVECML